MIVALARDAVRLLLRGRPVFLLLAVALVCGLFVRATRDVGVARLKGAVLPGAALETLASTVFLLAVAWGVVAGLLLAHEDRASGFFTHLAVRPVGRATVAIGRLAGLFLATVLALVPLGAIVALVAGLGERDLPTLRERVRPTTVEVGGAPLEAGAIGHVARGSPGRFVFAPGTRADATLRLRPKIPIGAAFSGRIALRVDYQPVSGASRTWEPEPFRPLRELVLHFDEAPGAGYALVVEPRDDTFVLEVDREALTAIGGTAPLAVELVLASLLVLGAGWIAAALAFFFGVGLSAGPASLAAAFVALVAMGRAAVLDIVAGIGATGADGGDPSAFLRWVRSTLTHLVRLVPDLARFNPAARLGEGEALPAADLLAPAVALLVTVGAVGLLTIAVLPFKER